MGGRNPRQKSGFWALAGGHFGDFDRHPQLDFGQHSVEPASPEASLRSVVTDFSRISVEGPSAPASSSTLSSSSTSSATRPRLDRAAAALRLLVLALQRDQRVDAADGAQRRHRLRRPRAPRSRRPKIRRPQPAWSPTERRPGRWRSVRRCAWRRLPAEAADPPRNTAEGRPVWLIRGKRPARFAGSAAGRAVPARAAQIAASRKTPLFSTQ